MKITRVNFKNRQIIMGVGSANSQLCVGVACDTQWGGGKITSLEYDPITASLAIRKGARFERINEGERAGMPSFDVALVPWLNVDCACMVDEEAPKALVSPVVMEMLKEAKEADPPPAKPIPQQGQSRR